MSDNALTVFGNGQLPAHISSHFSDVESNLPDREKVPSLSYEGKNWSISLNGTKTTLTSKNEDGDAIPIQTFKAIILNSNAHRGRAFYEGNYDPNKIAAPACWSDDGSHPAKAVKEPVASACDKCPNSVKGSKMLDNGKATVACSQHRMLVVVPAGKPDFTPLRLKIAITSDWDGQSPDQEAQGWFSYSKYLEFLKSRGVPHTAAVVTKIKFDPNAAYPKLFFAADRWLDEAEGAVAKRQMQLPEVKKLLDGSWSPAGPDGVRTETAKEPEPEPEVEAKPEPQIAPATAKVEDEPEPDFGEILTGDAPAADEAKPAKKAEPKKAAAKTEDPKPATSSTKVDDELAALLADWT